MTAAGSMNHLQNNDSPGSRPLKFSERHALQKTDSIENEENFYKGY